MAEKRARQEARQNEFLTEALKDKTEVRPAVKLPKGKTVGDEWREMENRWLDSITAGPSRYSHDEKQVRALNGFTYAVLETMAFIHDRREPTFSITDEIASKYGGRAPKYKVQMDSTKWYAAKLGDNGLIVQTLDPSKEKGIDHITEVIEKHRKELNAKYGGAVNVVLERHVDENSGNFEFYFHFFDAGRGFRY
jgi:hypothetical protein